MQIRDPHSQIEYKIEECVGEGLSSWVYKAYKQDREETFCHPVALKVFKSKSSDRILREDYESLIKMNSAHCVRVFGFDIIDGHPALVLEYVDGCSLLDLCLSGQISHQKLTDIVDQALNGLNDIHQQGLFHGDLSPNNILVSKEGEVKLIDFGYSNLHSDTAIHGTPDFLDPRLIKGQKMKKESDYFSLSEVYRFGAKFSDSFHQNVGDVDNNIQKLRRGQRIGDTTESLKLVVNGLRKILATAVFLGLLLPYGYVRSSSQSHIEKASVVHIRTTKWLKIRINNVDRGYSPVSAAVRPGTVIVEWSQNRGFQRRPLTIREGENIVLNDSFFDSSRMVDE